MIAETFAVVVGICLGGGLFVLLGYGFSSMLTPKIATPLGRLVFTVGALINGGSVLEFCGPDGYFLRPMEHHEGKWRYYKPEEKKWVEIESGSQHISRVGMAPFGIVAEKNELLFEDLLWKGKLPGKKYGNEDYIQPKRGSHRGFMPVKWYTDNNKKGWLISLTDLTARLKNAASTSLAERSFVEAIQEFAYSGFSALSVGHAVFYLAAAALGGFFAWLVIG